MTVPTRNPVSYATWKEEDSPYEVAVGAIPSLTAERPVFVDGEMRTFILDGLSKATPSTPVLSAPVEIQRLRQRKSIRELEIMRCANEVGCDRGLCSQSNSNVAMGRRPFWLSGPSSERCTSVSPNPRPALSSSGLSQPLASQVARVSCFSEVGF